MPLWKTARLTGYHPRDAAGKRATNQEGLDIDMNKQPLRYLENYNPQDPLSFVGLSADSSVFSYGDGIEIREYPGIRFEIRDNGGGFNKKTGESAFDMPVLTKEKAREITGTIHWRRIYQSTGNNSSSNIEQIKSVNRNTKNIPVFESSISGLLVVALIGFLIIGKKGMR